VFRLIFLPTIQGIINHSKAVVFLSPKWVLNPNTKMTSEQGIGGSRHITLDTQEAEIRRFEASPGK
jgi:hypothetical protein